MSIPFWQHQIDAIEYSMNQKSYSLLRMGVATGKTRTALEIIQRKGFGNVLIVGTKNSIYTWEKQAKEFGYTFPVKVFTEGSVLNRAFRLRDYFTKETTQYTSVAVINYEAFSKKVMLDRLVNIPIDCVIFDEVHRLRGHNSKQSKAAYNLFHKVHKNAFKIGLTGTLIYNKPLDVFGIFRFINPTLFGVSWTNFKYHYGIWRGKYNQIPVQYINLDDLKNKVLAHSFNVNREDALDLPDEQHIVQEITLAPKEQAEYNTFNKEFVLLMNEYREKAIPAKNVLDKVNKLQQLTGGFIYENQETHFFSSAKQEALIELLEEVTDNVVVFYKFKAEKELIKNAVKSLDRRCYFVDGSQSDYDAWLTDPVPSVLVVQISSGSEGIDFTKSNTTIFYSLVYSYGQFEQATGRTSRPNQKKDKVLYYYLVVKNTVDEKIMKSLQEKKDLIEELTN